MVTILIILGCVIIPPIINLFYAYIIVKYRLWNWVSDMVLFDMSSSHKIDKSSLISLVIPILSALILVAILALYFGWLLYEIFYIVLWPFVKLIDIIVNSFSKFLDSIREKNEYYEKLNSIKLKR